MNIGVVLLFLAICILAIFSNNVQEALCRYVCVLFSVIYCDCYQYVYLLFLYSLLGINL